MAQMAHTLVLAKILDMPWHKKQNLDALFFLMFPFIPAVTNAGLMIELS